MNDHMYDIFGDGFNYLSDVDKDKCLHFIEEIEIFFNEKGIELKKCEAHYSVTLGTFTHPDPSNDVTEAGVNMTTMKISIDLVVKEFNLLFIVGDTLYKITNISIDKLPLKINELKIKDTEDNIFKFTDILKV